MLRESSSPVNAILPEYGVCILESHHFRFKFVRTVIQDYLSQLEKEFFLEERLENTAARLGMSLRRFTTHFRTQAGLSRHQKITELRIAHACRLLSEPKRSVIGIAFECGYGDLSSFYRAFRKSKKRYPSGYRKQLALTSENASTQ